ncbi:polyprenyl synthetase family protein [bacterium]|nr:polyprenyl synthetase family protein [bacterium]
MSFEEKYKKIKELVDQDLYKIENNLTDFYCGCDELQENLITIIKAPSKRIRPLLALLYLKMYGKEITYEQIEIQSAVELIHNATLIHDDVIDKSSKRRNNKTINEAFDNSLAVVTGDFLLSVAIQKLLNVKSCNILNFFSIAIKRMSLGEISQYFNRFKLISFDEYLDKCRYKTAELFIASLTGSASVAGIDLNKTKDFGKRFGTAFQIRDDLLNVIETKSDKPTGNDIENGIYTAPMIFAKDIKNLNYGIEKTKELLDNYFNRVAKCLSNAPDNEYKQAIIELTEILKIK